MKRVLVVLAVFLAPLVAHGQRLNLELPGMAALADKASETVDVTLDGPLLRFAARFFSDSSDERAIKEMIQHLEGIYVRSYTFEEDKAYDPALLSKVRSQLGPSWKRMVDVKSKTKESVEIYTFMRGDSVVGLVILDAEPR